MGRRHYVRFTRDHIYDAKDGRGGGLQQRGSILEIEPHWPFYEDCMQRVDDRGDPLPPEPEIVASQASAAAGEAVAKAHRRLQPSDETQPTPRR